MAKPDYSSIVGAALAAGKLTRVSPGERAIDEKVFRRHRGDDLENALIAQRHIVVDYCGRERVRNGLGEWIG